jgi:transglutaminase-like putative cysteine protease
LLQQQRASMPGACCRFGYVLAGALLSIGIPARLVSLQASFSDGLGHIMVEAWVDELNKWVLVDATTDTTFRVNENYASLLEVRQALVTGALNSIRFQRNGSNSNRRLDSNTWRRSQSTRSCSEMSVYSRIHLSQRRVYGGFSCSTTWTDMRNPTRSCRRTWR